MKDKHILVIDDEEYMLRSLKLVLNLERYRVSTATNGKEALDVILLKEKSDNPVDLIITDIWMPQLTGIELLKKLNKLNINKPFLAITALGDKDVIIDLLQKGCIDYIDKPFDDDMLLGKIEKIFEREKCFSK